MLEFEIKNEKDSLKLPALSFGTASFERSDSDEVYFELLDTFYKCGGRCIDTARVYCSWLEEGLDSSEGVIGRWMRARGNRDDIILCTKGGHPPIGEMERSRLSRAELEYDISRSLEVLGTDHIDVYFVHRDDERIPVEEIMPILNDFHRSGRARFLGASNWTAARIEAANKFAVENGMEPFRVSQINYSLAHSSTDTFGDPTVVCMNLREFKWYQRNQFPVMAYCPQAKGFFREAGARRVDEESARRSVHQHREPCAPCPRKTAEYAGKHTRRSYPAGLPQQPAFLRKLGFRRFKRLADRGEYAGAGSEI